MTDCRTFVCLEENLLGGGGGAYCFAAMLRFCFSGDVVFDKGFERKIRAGVSLEENSGICLWLKQGGSTPYTWDAGWDLVDRDSEIKFAHYG